MIQEPVANSSIAGKTELRVLRTRTNVSTDTLLTYGILYFAVGWAALLRLTLLEAGNGFPLNDGGMFYNIIQDIQASGYDLPRFISYNGGEIPMAYSPLAFYAAAALNDLFGFPVLDILRYLPLLFSVATLFAVFFLVRDVLMSERLAAVAVLVFSFLPQAFEAQIAGGGLTRSPALFFAIIAIHQAYRLSNRPRIATAFWLSLCLAITVLTHQEYALFIGTSSIVFMFFSERRRTYFSCLMLSLVIAVAMSAPWWGTVLWRHGLTPFWEAAQTGNTGPSSWGSLIALDYTGELLFPLAGALGLLGVLTCLRDRTYLLPLWLIGLFIFDTRIVATTSAVVTAMLAAVALRDLILPLIAGNPSNDRSLERLPRRVWVAAVWALGFGTVSILGWFALEEGGMRSLSQENRSAVAWVDVHLPADSRFLLVSGIENPGNDRMSEWFPALTGKVSVATFQGQEWTGQWWPRVHAYEDLQTCAIASVDCLDNWEAKYSASYDFVLLSQRASLKSSDVNGLDESCCPGLRASLLSSSDHRVIYDEDGVSIFQRQR